MGPWALFHLIMPSGNTYPLVTPHRLIPVQPSLSSKPLVYNRCSRRPDIMQHRKGLPYNTKLVLQTRPRVDYICGTSKGDGGTAPLVPPGSTGTGGCSFAGTAWSAGTAPSDSASLSRALCVFTRRFSRRINSHSLIVSLFPNLYRSASLPALPSSLGASFPPRSPC